MELKKEPKKWAHLSGLLPSAVWSRQLLGQALACCSVLVLLVCLVHLNRNTVTSSASTQAESSLLGVTPAAVQRFKLESPYSGTRFAETKQEDLFLSVKTSKQFHAKRLDLILSTWFQLARDETWFFTDEHDEQINAKANGHLRVTECSSSHSRQALCCKMAAEFDAFLDSGKRWFCHFDDDNYVNVPALLAKLQKFDHRKDWYLGKPSIPEPLEILDRDSMQKNLRFSFATGGAGFCLSQALAVKMIPAAGGGKFESVADKIRLPDDVTMGYLAEHVLNTPLTVIPEFHSHLEPQRYLGDARDLADQISFSYSRYGDEMNVVRIDGFSLAEDPTRFRSLHCRLFPNFSWCPRKSTESRIL